MAVKFFRKNLYDLSNTFPTTTVTDAIASDNGEDYVDLMRNRNNTSGWSTTDSTDAANTTLEIDFNDSVSIDAILLLGHNLKAFTIKYNLLGVWTAFSTPIAETANTQDSNYYSFASVVTDGLQIRITGAQTVNADKYIKQFIATELLGALSFEPEVEPQFDKDRKVTKYLSGKSYIAKSVGGFTCRMRMKSASVDADLAVIEQLFRRQEGFLLSLGGGEESQFTDGVREGYRREDVFLMDLSNEYTPKYVESRWAQGLEVDMKLVEVN